MLNKYQVFKNGQGKYRVKGTETGEWVTMLQDLGVTVVSVYKEYDTYEQAKKEADNLNRASNWVLVEEPEQPLIGN